MDIDFVGCAFSIFEQLKSVSLHGINDARVAGNHAQIHVFVGAKMAGKNATDSTTTDD